MAFTPVYRNTEPLFVAEWLRFSYAGMHFSLSIWWNSRLWLCPSKIVTFLSHSHVDCYVWDHCLLHSLSVLKRKIKIRQPDYCISRVFLYRSQVLVPLGMSSWQCPKKNKKSFFWWQFVKVYWSYKSVRNSFVTPSRLMDVNHLVFSSWTSLYARRFFWHLFAYLL